MYLFKGKIDDVAIWDEALTNAEKIDSALPRVKDLEIHDKEMEKEIF